VDALAIVGKALRLYNPSNLMGKRSGDDIAQSLDALRQQNTPLTVTLDTSMAGKQMLYGAESLTRKLKKYDGKEPTTDHQAEIASVLKHLAPLQQKF
jgi:hypothetical protein